jgi:hypothetical protein
MDEIIPNEITFLDNNSLNIKLDSPEEIFVVIRESDNNPEHIDY